MPSLKRMIGSHYSHMFLVYLPTTHVATVCTPDTGFLLTAEKASENITDILTTAAWVIK